MNEFFDIIRSVSEMFREDYGVAFKVQRTGEIVTGNPVPLALTDFPSILTEGGATFQPNVFELNPIQFANVSPSADIVANDYLTYPDTGDDTENRYRVQSANPAQDPDGTAYLTVLAFAAPNTE
jgi:hypothetical protein